MQGDPLRRDRVREERGDVAGDRNAAGAQAEARPGRHRARGEHVQVDGSTRGSGEGSHPARGQRALARRSGVERGRDGIVAARVHHGGDDVPAGDEVGQREVHRGHGRAGAGARGRAELQPRVVVGGDRRAGARGRRRVRRVERVDVRAEDGRASRHRERAADEERRHGIGRRTDDERAPLRLGPHGAGRASRRSDVAHRARVERRRVGLVGDLPDLAGLVHEHDLVLAGRNAGPDPHGRLGAIGHVEGGGPRDEGQPVRGEGHRRARLRGLQLREERGRVDGDGNDLEERPARVGGIAQQGQVGGVARVESNEEGARPDVGQAVAIGVHGLAGEGIADEAHGEHRLRAVCDGELQRSGDDAKAHRADRVGRHGRRACRVVDLERRRVERDLPCERHVLADQDAVRDHHRIEVAVRVEHAADEVTLDRSLQQVQRRDGSAHVGNGLDDVLLLPRQAGDLVVGREPRRVADDGGPADDLHAHRLCDAQRRRRVRRIVAIRLHDDVPAHDRRVSLKDDLAAHGAVGQELELLVGHGDERVLAARVVRSAGLRLVAEGVWQCPDLPALLDHDDLVLALGDEDQRLEVGSAHGERLDDDVQGVGAERSGVGPARGEQRQHRDGVHLGRDEGRIDRRHFLARLVERRDLAQYHLGEHVIEAVAKGMLRGASRVAVELDAEVGVGEGGLLHAEVHRLDLEVHGPIHGLVHLRNAALDHERGRVERQHAGERDVDARAGLARIDGDAEEPRLAVGPERAVAADGIARARLLREVEEGIELVGGVDESPDLVRVARRHLREDVG